MYQARLIKSTFLPMLNRPYPPPPPTPPPPPLCHHNTLPPTHTHTSTLVVTDTDALFRPTVFSLQMAALTASHHCQISPPLSGQCLPLPRRPPQLWTEMDIDEIIIRERGVRAEGRLLAMPRTGGRGPSVIRAAGEGARSARSIQITLSQEELSPRVRD